MKSTSEYDWHGHHIKIQASASPQFLWLDYKFDVKVDEEKVNYLSRRSLTHSHTSFTLQHQGKSLRGRVVSTGFPCAPVISQSTIIDDTIVGHSQLLVSKRFFTYAFLSALAISLQAL